MTGLKDSVFGMFGIKLHSSGLMNHDEIKGMFIDAVQNAYAHKEAEASEDLMRYVEKMIFLQVIDAQWKDHLLAIDHMKQASGFGAMPA